MNTRNQYLIAVSVLIAITTATTANAGILDWFTSNGALADQASTGSFDSLYASVLTGDTDNQDRPVMTANALVPASSPTGKVTPSLRKTYWVQVSGYNSEVAQTDASPFITAKGTYVRDGIVAANSLNGSGINVPFGTAIKFKDCGSIDPDKIYVVEDRMNKRYQKNVDIWFESKAEALKLGRRTCQIEVIQ